MVPCWSWLTWDDGGEFQFHGPTKLSADIPYRHFDVASVIGGNGPKGPKKDGIFRPFTRGKWRGNWLLKNFNKNPLG
jgi:hypothetical protein